MDYERLEIKGLRDLVQRQEWKIRLLQTELEHERKRNWGKEQLAQANAKGAKYGG